jgi:hypothetical membrane protein
VSEAARPSIGVDRSYDIDRWFALGGVVGPILFVAMFTFAGAIRAGYSPIHQAISDLGVGPNPWLLNASLIIMGVLLVGFAIGFFRSAEVEIRGRWRWVCAVLIAFPGIGFLDAGVLTEAPATVTLHWVPSNLLITIGSLAGFFIVGLKLRRDSRWHGLSTYSMITSPATLFLLAAEFWIWAPGTPLFTSHLGGLMERVLFVEILAWYVVFGWRLFRAPGLAAVRFHSAGRG